MANTIVDYRTSLNKYVTYGNVRFDTVLQEPIFLSDNLSSFNGSVNSNLPDRNLGFSGSDRGSNVADMLRGYLTSKPTCGTIIHLNMKRNVHEEDLSDVIELLRKHRVYVVTIGSNTMVNSEDTFKQLHAMSVGSNGLLSYDDDSDFDRIYSYLVTGFTESNPYYVASAQVSGKGSVELPMFHKLSGSGYIEIGVNTQDHAGPVSNRAVSVNFDGPTKSYPVPLQYETGTFIFQSYDNFDLSQDYNMTLDYQYTDNQIQTMDIRIHVNVPVNQWPPYPSN